MLIKTFEDIEKDIVGTIELNTKKCTKKNTK